MTESERRHADEALVDEVGRESFPASDPPATWSGPDVVPAPEQEGGAARRDRPSSRDAGDAPGADETDDSTPPRPAPAVEPERRQAAREATEGRAPSP